MINRLLNEKIHHYLTLILSFFIPVFPDALPLIIALIGLNWLLFPKNISESFKIIQTNFSLVIMCLLYVLYLIGLAYSDNLILGLQSIETKLSLLLLPLIYCSFSSLINQNINTYLKVFVLGCITYAFIAFGWASYYYFKPVYTDLYGVLYDLGVNYFYYSYLSKIFHPSFTAMYCVFALCIIVYLQSKKTIKDNWLWLSVVLFLNLYILLLSSRAAWITLSLWLLAFIYFKIKNKKALQASIVSFFLIGGFLFFNVYYTPSFSKRAPAIDKIKNAITEKDDKNNKVTSSDESSARRIFVWKASLELIKQNLLIGVGTGDAKDKMMEKYLEKGMVAEHKAQLNSHNQYLNTGVAIGIIGIMVLILSLAVPFFRSIKSKQYLLSGFVVILALNFLFESMLEKQAGVIFYAFLNTILCLSFLKQKQH